MRAAVTRPALRRADWDCGRTPPPPSRERRRCASSGGTPPGRKGGLMAVTVKRITLWRADVDNHPGALARTLEPLAQAGADLRLVMGYRLPQTPERAAIELYPVSGKRATAAAAQAGLAEAPRPRATRDDRSRSCARRRGAARCRRCAAGVRTS